MKVGVYDMIPLFVSYPKFRNVESSQNPKEESFYQFRGLGSLDKFRVSVDVFSEMMFDEEVSDKEKIKSDIFSVQREWAQKETLRLRTLKLKRMVGWLSALLIVMSVFWIVYFLFFASL
jgi:hypothetical protein